MSGVLCRCTGYRGILDAVAEVAAEYPDGVPAPMNCAPRTLVGRGGGATEPVPDDADEVGLATTTEVQAPRGTPSATVEVTSALTSPVGDVWEVLTDFDRLARCLPGAELTETLGGDRYRGRAGVALGPVKLSFQGLAQVVERDAGAHLLHFIGQGADTGGSATQADVRLRAEAAPDGGTVLRADADLFLSGRIAQFGRALAGDVSRRLFEQFATAVDAAASGQEPPATAKGPSTLRLAAGAVLDGLRRRIEALRARRCAAADRLLRRCAQSWAERRAQSWAERRCAQSWAERPCSGAAAASVCAELGAERQCSGAAAASVCAEQSPALRHLPGWRAGEWPPADDHPVERASNRSRNGSWPRTILVRAVDTSNHAARSISGNSCIRPDRGGHSRVKTLLTIRSASRSPRSANAVTCLPPDCRTVPRSTSSPGGGGDPSSSVNSRAAAAAGFSSGSYSPFGIDHAASSFRAQNGPPMCPRSTSGPAGPPRCNRIPALRLVTTGA